MTSSYTFTDNVADLCPVAEFTADLADDNVDAINGVPFNLANLQRFYLPQEAAKTASTIREDLQAASALPALLQ